MRGRGRVRRPALTVRVLMAVLASVAAACRAPSAEPWPPPLDDATFREMVEAFSEPAGTYTPRSGYQSDNLVSNERSLQQVMPALDPLRRAGAYLGVGPEQNFTYIAALEPTIAFIVDIRRENFLLHLLYKALAEDAGDRREFVSNLFARELDAVTASSARELFAAVERSPRSEARGRATTAAVLGRLTNRHGLTFSAADRKFIADVLTRFAADGPSIRWDAGGSWIPTYSDLMTAADPAGVPRSYLASEASYHTFRRYHLRNRIVPLVGDFGGTHTLRVIADYLRRQRDTVSVFYTSNVEGYVRGEANTRFVASVAALPRTGRSIFVRTLFQQVGNTGIDRPDYSTRTMTEPIDEYVAALDRSPWK